MEESLKDTLYAIGYFISKDMMVLNSCKDWEELTKKHMGFQEMKNYLSAMGIPFTFHPIFPPPRADVTHENFERFKNRKDPEGARDAAQERWKNLTGTFHGTQERVIWKCAEYMQLFKKSSSYESLGFGVEESCKADCDVIMGIIADKKTDASASEDLIETVYGISFLSYFWEDFFRDPVGPSFASGEIYDHPDFDELFKICNFKHDEHTRDWGNLFVRYKSFNEDSVNQNIRGRDRWNFVKDWVEELDFVKQFPEKFGIATGKTEKEMVILNWINSLEESDLRKIKYLSEDSENTSKVSIPEKMILKVYADKIVDLLELRSNAPNARTGCVGPTACVYCGKHIRKK